MNALLFILSVMTFTVQSKSSVSMDGIWPSIQVEYSNTGTKGNVGENDVACLMLSELGGITVNQVDVYVNSNKTSGAGNFEVRANGSTIGTKTGNFKDWTGAYDNQNYHAISLLQSEVSNVHELTIQLIGSVSSLHIEKFVITYGNAPAKTVTLMNGNTVLNTLTEETGGQGVLLPTVPDIESWKFIGWSDIEFDERSSLPAFYQAYSKYYPSENCTLWAIYMYVEETEIVYVTDLSSGDYVYANRSSQLAMAGVPADGIIDRAAVNISDDEQIYSITFVGADTAYITHKKSGTPIGYTAGAKMTVAASLWLVYHDGDQTLFYAVINSKNYVLWLNVLDSGNEGTTYAGLLQANPGQSPMGLIAAQQGANEPIFTCHPERGMDIVAPNAEMPEYIMHFGIYELRIKNGQKQLRIQQ